MSELKRRIQSLAEGLREFSGQDFSDPSVQRHFQARLAQVLGQMEALGVIITSSELSGYDNFGRSYRAMFSGVEFEHGSSYPEYVFTPVMFNGRKL